MIGSRIRSGMYRGKPRMRRCNISLRRQRKNKRPTSEWIQQPHAVHGPINGLLREAGLHVMACGRYPYNPLGGQQRLHRQDTITQNQHGQRSLPSLARVVIGRPIQQLQKMMKEQFDCHVRYGNLKTPYNLEPSRTSISQITCN